jgi:hypothetical protein
MKNAVFWDVRRVALVRTEVSQDRSASTIRVTRIGELPGDMFLRNVGSYKNHTASHPR